MTIAASWVRKIHNCEELILDYSRISRESG